MCCKNMDREQLKLGDFFAFGDTHSYNLYLCIGDNKVIIVYSDSHSDTVGHPFNTLAASDVWWRELIKVDLDVFDKETGEIVRRI